MVFLASDRHKVVVSPVRLTVAGGNRHGRGPVEEHRAPGGDRVDLHGSSLRRHLIVILLAGAGYAAATAGGAPNAARVLCVALLAALFRTWVVGLRTRRLAARLRDDAATYAIQAAPDRADLDELLTLVDRIWDNHRHLPDLLAGAETRVLLDRAVTEAGEALRRRQRLREIRADLGARSSSGLPSDSVAVLADREQRTRAEGLWNSAGQEVGRHLAALRATADAGTELLRERELGAAARRTRAALDEVEAPGPPVDERASTRLDRRTGVYVAAYRDLARRYGAEMYA